MSRCGFIVAISALGTPGALLAQAETTTFEYDAQGRLTESARVGGPADGTVKTLTYDRAGNRTNQTVTGAPGGQGMAAPSGGEAMASGEAEEASVPEGDPPVSEGAPLLDAPGSQGPLPDRDAAEPEE